MTCMTITEYLCHTWPRIRSVCLNHNSVLSSFITYHRVCSKRNSTSANSKSRSAYPARAHGFTLVFIGSCCWVCTFLCSFFVYHFHFVLFALSIVLSVFLQTVLFFRKIFVQFCGLAFQQTIGIQTGRNCASLLLIYFYTLMSIKI